MIRPCHKAPLAIPARPKLKVSLPAVPLIPTPDTTHLTPWKLHSLRKAYVVSHKKVGRVYKLGGANPKYKLTLGPGEYTAGFMDSIGTAWVIGNDHSIDGANGTSTAGVPHKLITSPTGIQMAGVASGLHDGAFWDVNGNVWTYGSDQYCQLGNGSTSGPSSSYRITVDILGHPFTGITMVSAGWGLAGNSPFYTAIKAANDTVWIWGNLSTVGGSTCQLPTPYLLASGKLASKIYAYTSSVHVVCSDGTVQVLGGTDDHSQNTGTNTTPTSFTTISGLTNIAFLAKGNSFAFAVNNGGTSIYGWGEYGAILKGGTTLGFDPEGTPILLNTYLDSLVGSPYHLDTLVAAHTAWSAIRSDSTLWAGGSNEPSLCGTGTQLNWSTYTGSAGFTPWAWDFNMGELMVAPFHALPGKHNFVAVFGGPLYSFYMFAEDVNGNAFGAGRQKAGGLMIYPNLIPADTTGGRIAGQYGTSWNVIRWTPVFPWRILAAGRTGVSVTTSPGCILGVLGTTYCQWGTDAPTRPNTNLSAGLVLTANPSLHTIHWDNTTSTTDGSHKINQKYITFSGTNPGVVDGDSGTIYNVGNGSYTITLKIVDQSWDTASTTQSITVSPQSGYYFADSADGGNDGNAGTLASPYRTITKFNSIYSTLGAGDTVYFHANDTFPGQLVCNTSGAPGNPIVTRMYGTGSEPLLGGMQRLSGWTHVSGNVWSTPWAGPIPNLLTINGALATISRTPNLSTGYFIFNPSASSTTTINDINNASKAKVGSQIVVRSAAYIIDKTVATAVTSNTVTVSPAVSQVNIGGDGWFIYNNLPDTAGEWRDTANTIQVYSVGSPTAVYKVPTVDTILLTEGTYQIFDHLHFQGGNYDNIVAAFQATGHVSLTNDSIDYGVDGIQIRTEGNLLVNNCYIAHMGDNGVLKLNTNNYNNTYTNDMVFDAGMIPGMGGSGGNQNYSGIIAGDSNSVVSHNFIDSIGYIGIANYGSGFVIDSNIVGNVCQVKEDGGFIYTWMPGIASFYAPRVIIGNVGYISGGPMSHNGDNTTLLGCGIYLDSYTSAVSVLNNTVSRVNSVGYFDHGPNNTFTGNTSYGAQYADFLAAEIGPVISGLVVKYNIFGSATPTSPAVRITTINNDLSIFGPGIDSNLVAGTTGTIRPYWTFSTGAGDPGTFRTQGGWTTLTGYDAHSTVQLGTFLFYYGTSTTTTVYLQQQYANLRDGVVHFRTYTIPAYTSSLLAYYGFGYLKHVGKIVLRTAP